MNKITSADIIDNGKYIIGEKNKVIDFLLNGIFQQIVDYYKQMFVDDAEKSLENLVDNMEKTTNLLKSDDFINADKNDIIKVNYSNEYIGMVLSVYEEKN